MPGGHTAVIKEYPCMPKQHVRLWFGAWHAMQLKVPCADSAMCVSVPECAFDQQYHAVVARHPLLSTC